MLWSLLRIIILLSVYGVVFIANNNYSRISCKTSDVVRDYVLNILSPGFLSTGCRVALLARGTRSQRRRTLSAYARPLLLSRH